jgi:oxygen-independent coproporphyrinogen-3 oxidase
MASPPDQPPAAYIHVPFCRQRCGYCNFTLVAGRDDLIAAYLDALAIELAWLGGPHSVQTLFLGGGTPTHLPPKQLERLLTVVQATFPLAAGGEFSIEANPIDLCDAAGQERTRILAAAGVTRVSLGAQSFDPAKLALLERDHQATQIEQAVAQARTFAPSVSLDLIFGTPSETLAGWQNDLSQALALGPDHLSTYGLTFEKGTAFWTRLARGELVRAAEEDERAMYVAAIDLLSNAGFDHYEVSNFARPGHRCRHNETYWTGGEFFAAGPGAARFIAGRRETNHRSTTTYIRRVLAGQSPVAETESLGPEDAARERLVFALRRLEGIDLAAFAAATGFSARELGGNALARFVELGLLQQTNERLSLTSEGLLVSDAMWPEFLRH